MASQGLLEVGPGHVGQSCLQRLALVACFSEKLETIPAGTKPRTSHHYSLEERVVERGSTRLTIFLERMREGHRQSDEYWNRFKGNVGETSERRSGAYMGFSERIDTILK